MSSKKRKSPIECKVKIQCASAQADQNDENDKTEDDGSEDEDKREGKEQNSKIIRARPMKRKKTEAFITKFSEMVKRVKRWVSKSNKLPISTSKNTDEKELASWCAARRKSFKNKTLTAEEKKEIEEINGWYWNYSQFMFNKKLPKLKEFVSEHKMMPLLTSTGEEKKLAQWVADLKKKKKNGKLMANQIATMTAIPGWKWNDKIIDKRSFSVKYDELLNWIRIHNKMPSSRSTDKQEAKLGQWCSGRKKAHKKKKLIKDQFNKLSEIPQWKWIDENSSKKSFDVTYKQLIEWMKIHKKTPTTNSKNKQERSLGSWCQSRRDEYRQSSLSYDKIILLDKLDGWFWAKKDTFSMRVLEYCQWMTDNIILPSSSSFLPDERSLFHWISGQRRHKKNGKIKEDKIKALELLPGWSWDHNGVMCGSAEIFNVNILNLKTWITTNGRMPRIISPDEKEVQYAQFCQKAQSFKKFGNLIGWQVREFESITCWCWNKPEFSEKTFELLKSWMTEHKRVPSCGSANELEKRLGSWSGRQRKKKITGQFTDDVILRFAVLPGWYWTWDDKLTLFFNRRFSELKIWIEDNKHLPRCILKDENETESLLGRWCSKKRSEYYYEVLPAWQKEKLETIPGWLWVIPNTRQSQVALDCLRYYAIRYTDLQTIETKNGEFKIPNTRYHLDGYSPSTKTAIDFYGDFWHGNPQIYSPMKKFPCGSNVKTFGDMYQKVMLRHEKVISISEVESHIQIWENDWRRGIKLTNKIKRRWRLILMIKRLWVFPTGIGFNIAKTIVSYL